MGEEEKEGNFIYLSMLHGIGGSCRTPQVTSKYVLFACTVM